MKLTVESVARAPRAAVWRAWTDPQSILIWNTASDDWHTTEAEVDLRVGGRIRTRMEARDGSEGFDFVGVFTEVRPDLRLAFLLDDDREVLVEFVDAPEGTVVRETFEAESSNDPELQRIGWQAIFDSFTRFVSEHLHP